MPAIADMESIHTFEFTRDQQIDAPIDIVFAAVLEEMGPEQQMMNGQPMPAKVEPWPGGRWFRDLGDNKGHFWGHVQVIKPPTLIEICGPMFMSYPAMNHVQYRLTSEEKGTRLQFVHKAIGLIPQEHREGMDKGWGYKLGRIKELAERKLRGK
jgi:uncharacterized protein YndB with AHSA1/START domain